MRRIIQLSLAIALIWSSIATVSQVKAASQTASFEQLSGTVELKRIGQDFFKQALTGQHVKAGDILRTGINGKAMLRLMDGSTFSFAEETEFMFGSEIDCSPKGLIGTLFRGVGRAILQKREQSYISTPAGTIGIRGTDITFTHSGKTGFYFLNEGGIDVRNNGGRIILEAGSMTASYRGRKPLPPSSFAKSPGLTKARTALSALTTVKIPSSLKEHALLNEILARWVINYANYLAETGRHADAETALLIAEDLTERYAVEGEILLHIGGLYFYRLNDAQNALRAYERIINNYSGTPHSESALFGAIRSADLLKQQDKVLKYIKQYRIKFPNGKHLQELETMLW